MLFVSAPRDGPGDQPPADVEGSLKDVWREQPEGYRIHEQSDPDRQRGVLLWAYSHPGQCLALHEAAAPHPSLRRRRARSGGSAHTTRRANQG